MWCKLHKKYKVDNTLWDIFPARSKKSNFLFCLCLRCFLDRNKMHKETKNPSIKTKIAEINLNKVSRVYFHCHLSFFLSAWMIHASIADAPTLSIDDKLWFLIHLFILSECHLNEYFADDSDGRSLNSGRTHLVWKGCLTSHTGGGRSQVPLALWGAVTWQRRCKVFGPLEYSMVQ